MLRAEFPENEPERLAVLKSYRILDTPPEPQFDQLVQLAAEICQVPITLISLVDEKRQWFKARVGLDATETHRDLAFCAHALLQTEPLVVSDATQDPRFFDNPLVLNAPHIRFYAGAPLQSPEGQVLGTLCVIDQKPRELTPFQLSTLITLANQATQLLVQHRYANQLQEQKALLEQMSHMAQIGAWELRLHDDRAHWSAEIYPLFDVAADEQLTWQAMLDFYSPESQTELKQAIDQALNASEKTSKKMSLELPFTGRRGITRWSCWHFQARYDQGQATHLWGMIQDITQQKQDQAHFQRFQSYQEQLTRVSFQLELSQADLMTQGLSILKSFLNMNGANITRVFGDTLEILTLDDDQQTIPDYPARTPLAGSFTELVFQSRDVLTLDSLRASAPDRVKILESYGIRTMLGAPFHVQGAPFHVQGAPFGVVICHDSAFRPEGFQAQEKEFLVFFCHWLGFMFERGYFVENLQKLNIGKDRLLAVVAHDLRNPLAAIQSSKWMIDGFVERGESLDPRLLNIIDSACKQAFTLIDELLEVSDLEQQQLSLPMERLSLDEIVHNVLLAFEPLAAKKKIRLVPPSETLSLPVSLNRKKFTRVLENLLNNALKFTPENGEIRVMIEEAGREAWLSIEDTGIGIAPEMQAVLFNKFTQARREGLAGERSMGLGMHIVQEIVQLHGGRIEVFSQVNQGSRFQITLPLIRELKAHSPERQQILTRPVRPPETGDTAHPVLPVSQAYSILVVDDDRTYIRIMEAVLSPLGYRLHFLRESAKVLGYLREQPCDLVLMDIQMPETSGIELCQQMKATPELAEIPVIFITGNEEEEILIQAFEAGCADYVTKPFLREELQARIQTQLHLRESDLKLKKQLALRELLLSQLSHDLRGPIGTTTAYLKWLLGSNKSLDPSRPMFEKLSESLEKTYAMLENMLRWAQSVQGDLPFQQLWFDWSQLGQECLDQYQLQAAEKELSLHFELSGPERIFADTNLLRVILINLIGNAIKYSYRGGKVSLCALKHPQMVEIQMSDTGTGLSAKVLAQLEQHQPRVSQPGTENETGTGMGFRICQEFAARHEGYFKIVSQPGQGTCFSLFLPQPALQL